MARKDFSKNKVFTVLTRLNTKDSKELIDYFRSLVPYYAKIFRSTWQDIQRNSISMLKDSKSKSQYNTFLQGQYHISKRTANSIINDVVGSYDALLELKKYEIIQLDGKIEAIQGKIDKLK